MPTEADYMKQIKKEILQFLSLLGKRYEKYYEVVVEETTNDRVDFRINKTGDPFVHITGMRIDKLASLPEGLFTITITNLDFPLRHYRLFDFILCRCFREEEDGVIRLRPRYKESGIVYPRQSCSADGSPGIPLTPEILRLAQLFVDCKRKRLVGLMGIRSYEAVAERMDNFLYTGNCDYVIKADHPQYGPPTKQVMSEETRVGIETLVERSLNGYGGKIKTTKIYIGNGRWKTVLTDPRVSVEE